MSLRLDLFRVLQGGSLELEVSSPAENERTGILNANRDESRAVLNLRAGLGSSFQKQERWGFKLAWGPPQGRRL